MTAAPRAARDPGPAARLRPLSPGDLDAAVALDASLSGRSRRGYFQKRLAAALRDPAGHIQFALETEGGGYAGHVLARLREEEFGRRAPVVAFEAIAVDPDTRGHGLGHLLIGGIEDVMWRKGIGELQTDALWTDHRLLRFLDSLGFRMAPRQVIARPVGGGLAMDAGRPDETAASGVPIVVETRAEIDYGDPIRGDFEPLAHDRVPVRSLRPEDLDTVARIDRRLVGRDRTRYLRKKVDEAMFDSAIRVSLVAELDGTAAGFVMARTDFGEFGHSEPTAILDTIGVDPSFAGRGVGAALVSQLLANLGGLRVEAVETEVSREDFSLLGFLYRCGFEPSQRLVFTKTVPPRM